MLPNWGGYEGTNFFNIFVRLGTAKADVDTSCSFGTSCLPINFEIEIYGKQMAPKPEDYDAVRNAVSSLIADVLINRYVLLATGVEGGFHVCIEPANRQAYNEAMSRIGSIEVDTTMTYFSIKHTDFCK